MDIPMGAEVQCVDGPCGRSSYITLDPVRNMVTHVVVLTKQFPSAERLVPISYIIEATPKLIKLRCSAQELRDMKRFIEFEFVQSESPQMPSTYLWPFAVPDSMAIPLEHENIPLGELAIRRGTHVDATDGRVGRVDEFLVDPTNGHITHLVLREGHLWGQKDVVIPVSQIRHFDDDSVALSLDKASIESLPAISVRR